MKTPVNVKMPGWAGWIMVPLRLFLGITFVYAGIQKLTDPQYFDPRTTGYIGQQISGFAHSSPLQSFLLNVAAPHALFVGALVAYGEVAIGLGTLLGLFFCVSALFGVIINLIFFLSATWQVFPYFYGSDIVFIFCWLTLLLAGPANQALPALDIWLVARLIERVSPATRPRLSVVCAFFFGVKLTSPSTELLRQPERVLQGASVYNAWQSVQTRPQSRRNFLWGTLAGGATMFILAWLAETRNLFSTSANAGGTSTQIPATVAPGSSGGASTPSSPQFGEAIAKMSAVAPNSAFPFTLPSGDPGVLIHLTDGQFVAYDAICTHAGCQVDFDPVSQHLICPCHGATFDPTKAAAVLHGPALKALPGVHIQIDQSAGTVNLEQ